MANQIFVNLPVKNLARSVEFFAKLGYTFDPQFTDENATCMIVGENIFVMLLVETFFANFTKKPLADAKQSTEAILALGLARRAQVGERVAQAVAAGGKAVMPAQDHGWMYQHGDGVPENIKEALVLYGQSASRGSSFGQASLGRCLEQGVGMPADVEAARIWYRKAREQADPVLARAKRAIGLTL